MIHAQCESKDYGSIILRMGTTEQFGVVAKGNARFEFRLSYLLPALIFVILRVAPVL
jgi:hypothetical protein